jgi:hypothetical protein
MSALKITLLDTKIDEVVEKRKKARSEWIVDSGNHEKFLKLHEAHMEYKKLVDQLISNSAW